MNLTQNGKKRRVLVEHGLGAWGYCFYDPNYLCAAWCTASPCHTHCRAGVPSEAQPLLAAWPANQYLEFAASEPSVLTPHHGAQCLCLCHVSVSRSSRPTCLLTCGPLGIVLGPPTHLVTLSKGVREVRWLSRVLWGILRASLSLSRVWVCACGGHHWRTIL